MRSCYFLMRKHRYGFMSEQLLSRMPTLRQRLRLKMCMSNLPAGLRLFPKGIHPDGMSYLLADKPGPPKTRSVRLECTEKLFHMPFCLFLSSLFLPRLDVSYSLGADSSQNLLKGRNRGHGSVPDGCGNGLSYFSSQLFFFFFSLLSPVIHLSAAETQQELCDVRADFTHTAREHTEKPRGST